MAAPKEEKPKPMDILGWYAEYERWVFSQPQLSPLTRHTYTTHAKRFAKWVEKHTPPIDKEAD